MAVLGVGGRLFLRRDAPEACVAAGTSLDNADNSLTINCPGYWSGDHVVTSCLPVTTGLFPPNPAGYASYFGSRYFLGPNRSHIANFDDTFYKAAGEEYPDGQAGDAAQFYARVGDTSGGEEIQGCTDQHYWVHVDALGRFSFYTDRCSALEGSHDKRLPLDGPIAGNIGIAAYGNAEYNNAIWQCFAQLGTYMPSDVEDSVTLVSICEDPPLYVHPIADTAEYDNADVRPRGEAQGSGWPYWQIICDLREWSLELSAPSVDTTAISEKFGEAVKSLVTGGGSAEFLIDRKCYDDKHDNGVLLMRLLLMTEKGCKASAEFFLMSREEGEGGTCSQIAGDLFYESELLVTASAVNVRPTEILAGTANFVTTGEIKLREAT